MCISWRPLAICPSAYLVLHGVLLLLVCLATMIPCKETWWQDTAFVQHLCCLCRLHKGSVPLHHHVCCRCSAGHARMSLLRWVPANTGTL